MATITSATNESVYQIKQWKGVNQSADGDTLLKNGEAAVMRNFRVTSGGAMQKRPGSLNVAGLLSSYTAVCDTTATNTLFTDYGVSGTRQMYPRTKTDTVGNLDVDGTAVSVTSENATSYNGYFVKTDSGVHKLSACEFTDTVAGVAFDYTVVEQFDNTRRCYMLVFPSPPVWDGTSWDMENATVIDVAHSGESLYVGKYTILNGERPPMVFSLSATAPEYSRFSTDSAGGYAKFVDLVSLEIWTGGGWSETISYQPYSTKFWKWNFHPMHSEGNTTDSVVRGIWSGYVDGDEVLCAACNGYLWELTNTGGVWSKVSCGAINTSGNVFMFGYDKKLYCMNGTQYKVWNGATFTDVEGYVPLILTATTPAGAGTTLEQINKLTGKRRVRFSPDGTATQFILPEKGLTSIDSVILRSTGAEMTGVTKDTANGKVTFATAPTAGTNTIEITYTFPTNYRSQVLSMKFAELYNGAQDSRVFIYGDGTNKCFYSGLTEAGSPTAEYFPDLNVCDVGDANTPITAMIRHYNRLLAFKEDSAYSIYYDAITLADGSVTAGFYITPVNKSIGNCASGQAQLVENKPRTLDGRSIYEWKSTSSSGNVTGDQRNAQRVSQRVDTTIRSFSLASAITYYDKITHEYYVIGSDGTAIVNNVDTDTWYIYTGFAATCMINYKDEIYLGTADGYLRHFSNDYASDNGVAIDAYWESGSMSFSKDFQRKYSAMLWVGIKPDDNGYLEVTAKTDVKTDFAEYSFSTDDAADVPTMNRIKLKAKKFTYYKLIMQNDTADKTVTVVSADIRIRGTGYVR